MLKFSDRDLKKQRKLATQRTFFNYCSVPGKLEPAVIGLADLQNPPPKWCDFRITAHNPEVRSSNLLPATKVKPESVSSGFSFHKLTQRRDRRTAVAFFPLMARRLRLYQINCALGYRPTVRRLFKPIYWVTICCFFVNKTNLTQNITLLFVNPPLSHHGFTIKM
jgi:hypothetical protein